LKKGKNMKGSKKQMNVLKKILKILLFVSVIMVTEGKELRIMSYNIYGSRLANGIKLGESIKKYRPDFVSLQEVDRDTKRSNFRDVTLDIASELGYNYYYFQKSRDFDSGEFGISFISKYPVEKIYAYELPSIGVEKRQVVIAELEKKEFGKKIMIINTHLDYRKEIKKEELESLSLLNGLFDSDIKFLSGDFEPIVDKIRAEMERLSAELKFEEAAKQRDLLNSVLHVTQKQKITSDDAKDRHYMY